MDSDPFVKVGPSPQVQSKGTGKCNYIQPQTPIPKMGAPLSRPKQYIQNRTGAFAKLASPHQFDNNRVPILAKHASYNDDVRLGGYIQSNVVRVDSQKRGFPDAIADALSYSYRIIRAASS